MGAPKHQTREGEYVNGSGIEVERVLLRGQTLISVNDSELACNPLAKAWVEALERLSATANRERQMRSDGLFT